MFVRRISSPLPSATSRWSLSSVPSGMSIIWFCAPVFLLTRYALASGISPRCSASSASTFRGHVLRGSSAAHVRPSRNSIRPFPSPYPATS